MLFYYDEHGIWRLSFLVLTGETCRRILFCTNAWNAIQSAPVTCFTIFFVSIRTMHVKCRREYYHFMSFADWQRNEARQREWVERIRVLVQLYPKATAIPDPDDNLPLEILARSTVVTYSHVGPVFESNPTALARFDLPETFYPYVLSQLARRKCVNGIFQVLKDTPTLAAIR